MNIYPQQIAIGATALDVQQRFQSHRIKIDPYRLSDDEQLPENARQVLKAYDSSYSQVAYVRDVYTWGLKGNLVIYLDTNGIVVNWAWMTDLLSVYTQDQVKDVVSLLDTEYGEHEVEEDDDDDEECLSWITNGRRLSLYVKYDDSDDSYSLFLTEYEK